MFGCQKDSLTVTETPQDSRIDFRAAEKLLVCHNTGSETNPYELIEVAEIAYMKAHQEHGDAQPGVAIPEKESQQSNRKKAAYGGGNR